MCSMVGTLIWMIIWIVYGSIIARDQNEADVALNWFVAPVIAAAFVLGTRNIPSDHFTPK